MKHSVLNAVADLQDAVMSSTDAIEFVQYIMENKDTIASALQLIADTDSEPLVETMTMVLWKACPEELEDHVLNTKLVWAAVIGKAWEEYQQDVEESLDEWIKAMVKMHNIKTKKGKKGKAPVGELPKKPDPKDVKHLNKCLNIS